MKKLLISALLIFAPILANANAGYYVQGEAGLAVAGYDDSDNITNSDYLSSSGFGSRISGGYLWGDNNFNYGLESGLFYGPSLSGDTSFLVFGPTENLKRQVINLDLLGVLKYTFNNGIALFTKAGAAYSHQKLTIDSNNVQPGVNNSGGKLAPEVALGAGYQFNQNFELDLTTNAVYTGGASASNPAANNGGLLLGLTYHFA